MSESDELPPFIPWTYNDRVRHGKRFAALHNSGRTMAEISTLTGESIPRIRLALSSIGYDPARMRRAGLPRPKPRKPTPTLPDGRPLWTVPDTATLAQIRLARSEALTNFNQELL